MTAVCSSAVAATCGALLIITSPVVRKPSEISFGLALWCAGKPLQVQVLYSEKYSCYAM